MALTTTESLLTAIEESDLLDAAQMTAAREMASQTDDPRVLAKLLVEKNLLSRWQAGQLLIGRTSFFIGRYKLIDLLGRGGMGSVFLARHTMMNRTVAVKMISRELSQDPASRERFLDEARAAASLDHPNIVHAYTVDSEDDRYYMVLEYVEGQDLQRLVESGGPLDFQQAADFIRQAADGLAHAHSRGMVHSDIKPSNLLVNPQGVLKILDMGMARLIGAGDGDREAGDGGSGAREGGAHDERILGSVDYMAPEQGVQGPELDHRADIYSLGCTLYFLLTGSPPFPEGTLPERILKHQSEIPPSILVKRPGAPRDLVKICEKMMAKEPIDRFQTAGEVSAILAAWRPPPQRVLKAVPIEEQRARDKGRGTGDAGRDVGRGAAEAKREPGDNWDETGYDLQLPVDLGQAARDELRHQAEDQTRIHRPSSLRRRRRSPWRIVVLAGCGLLAILLAVAGWHMMGGGRRVADDAGRSGPTSAGGTSPTPEPIAKPQPEKPKPEKPSKTGPSKSGSTRPGSETRGPSPGPRSGSTAPGAPAAAGPFRDVPAAVDLPPLAGDGSVAGKSGVSLISIDAPLTSPWTLKLIGGDRPVKDRTFTIHSPPRNPKYPTPASWLVQLTPAGGGKEEAPAAVARFWRQNETLMFQWMAGTRAVPADQFRNVAVEIRVGNASRTMALRTPKQVAPVTVDLSRPVVAGDVAVSWLPDPSCLRLEILGLEGRTGHTVKPAEPVAVKTFATLGFSKKDKRPASPAARVEFRVQLLVNGSRLAIELRQSKEQVARFQNNGRPLSREKIEAEIKSLKESIGKVRKQPKLSADQKKTNAASPEQKKMEERLQAAEVALWYDDFFQAVHQKSQLRFRVLADLGGYQLELARSNGG